MGHVETNTCRQKPIRSNCRQEMKRVLEESQKLKKAGVNFALSNTQD